MMIIHNQGAIDMANHLLEKGNDETIRAMAENVITEQQAEQQEFNAFLEGHTPEPSDTGQEYNNEMMESMEKSKNLKDIVVLTGDADEDFSQLMLVHHQAANDNAQGMIHHSHHQEIMDMAKTMSASQTQEMQELSAWLIANRDIQNVDWETGKKHFFEKHDTYATWTSQFLMKLKGWPEIAVAVVLLGSVYTVSVAGHHGSQLVFIEGIGPKGEFLETEGHSHSDDHSH